MRWILRIDAVTSSGPWFVVLCLVLLGLLFTDSPAGYVAAGVLFVAWLCIGIIGKRHQTANAKERGTPPHPEG